MTQNESILAYLKTGHHLSALDALHLFGCFRPAARVHNLRAEGHDIDSYTGASGGKKYTVYFLNSKKPR